jgi:hypothetical protein
MSNDKTKTDRAHGEGNYEASRKYLKDQKKFQEEHDVEKLGKEAKKAVGQDDGELAEAERKGKAHKKTS